MYDWIRYIPRKLGHTTAACGKSDRRPVIITATSRQAKQVCDTHRVKSVGLAQAYTRLLGTVSPVVFDLDAVQVIVSDYESKIRELRNQHEKQLDKIMDIAGRRQHEG